MPPPLVVWLDDFDPFKDTMGQTDNLVHLAGFRRTQLSEYASQNGIEPRASQTIKALAQQLLLCDYSECSASRVAKEHRFSKRRIASQKIRVTRSTFERAVAVVGVFGHP